MVVSTEARGCIGFKQLRRPSDPQHQDLWLTPSPLIQTTSLVSFFGRILNINVMAKNMKSALTFYKGWQEASENNWWGEKTVDTNREGGQSRRGGKVLCGNRGVGGVWWLVPLQLKSERCHHWRWFKVAKSLCYAASGMKLLPYIV